MNDLEVKIQAVEVTDDRLTFDLVDGRSISVPLTFYPSLLLATPEERRTFEIEGHNVHWPLLDVDLGSICLLSGAKEPSASVRRAYDRQAARQAAVA